MGREIRAGIASIDWRQEKIALLFREFSMLVNAFHLAGAHLAPGNAGILPARRRAAPHRPSNRRARCPRSRTQA
ncbi:hypothetical protein M2103_001996 [Ereboglobus sp. PH5-5]|nr:hypothetical protein [Ereboglobus sp. PH5-10]MDF9833763.1 hypothetical protein [Ereboglobus sp. PH5-5]